MPLGQFDLLICTSKASMAAMAKSSLLPLRPSLSRLKDYPFVDSNSSAFPELRYSSFPQLNVAIKRSRNASVAPVIRAQNSLDYVPDSKFYKVEAIIRSWRVQQVSSAMLKMGIRGVTVSDVRGFGAQGGSTERHGGSEFSEDNFVSKVKMEIVVRKDQVEAVIDKIIEEARTGEIGDGKIFLVPISDVIRIRTGERGETAEHMTGGLSDMSAAA